MLQRAMVKEGTIHLKPQAETPGAAAFEYSEGASSEKKHGTLSFESVCYKCCKKNTAPHHLNPLTHLSELVILKGKQNSQRSLEC